MVDRDGVRFCTVDRIAGWIVFVTNEMDSSLCAMSALIRYLRVTYYVSCRENDVDLFLPSCVYVIRMFYSRVSFIDTILFP